MLTIYLVSFFFIGLLVYGYKAKSKNEIIDFAFSSRQLTTPALIATLVTTWYGGINEIGIEVIQNGVVTWVYFGLFYYISALVYAFYIAPKILKKNHSSLPILIFKTYGKGVFVIFKIHGDRAFLRLRLFNPFIFCFNSMIHHISKKVDTDVNKISKAGILY